MRKILFVFVCLFVSLSVFAQQGNRGAGNRGTPEENARRTTEWMKTELNLTDRQVAPVDSINLVYARAQARLIESANGDFASIREAMQKINTDRIAAYEKVLTREQVETYRTRAPQQRQGGNRPGGGGNRQ